MKKFVIAATLASFATVSNAATLTTDAENAILTALMDEYKATATYEALIDQYGTNTPFSKIIKAEERHSDALIKLLVKYDVEVPTNPYLDGTMPLDPLPSSLVAAYEAGIEGELANIALYQDDLLPAVEAYPDITKVFTNLMSASQDKHLPTFENCVDGTCDSRHANATHGQQKQGHGQGNGHGGAGSKGGNSNNGKGRK